MSATFRRLCLALGSMLALLALVVDPYTLLPQLRESWFFDVQRVATLRWAVAGFGVALAFAPRLLEWLRREPSDEPPTVGSQRSDFLFVAALAAMALALEWSASPVSEDTKFYLGEALDLAERGGLGGLVERCLDGSWAEDNRHPLYLILIAPWAERSNSMLGASKLMSFVGAALTLLVVLRACRQRGGELAALAAGTLLVTNASFVEFSVLTACESWWTLFAVLALDLATRAGDPRPSRHWFTVGLFLGLAFLTKGTGVLLALSVGLAVLWNERRASLRTLWPMAAGFTTSGLILLVRNQLRYGDALFNVNSRRGIWLDRWEQFYDAEALANASASAWFERHTLADALLRMGSGLVKQAAHALEAAQAVAPGGVGALIGAVILVLLSLGLLRMRDRRERGLLLLLVVLWVASFAWYAQIASDRRFLAVLVPLLAPALVSWTSRATASEQRTLRTALLGFLALSVAVALAPAVRFARAPGFRESNESRELHTWLLERESAGRDVVYLLGPSSELGFDWDRSLLATRAPRPVDDAALAQLLATPEGASVRYLVVETFEPAARAGSRWPQDPGSVPPGWQLAASFPASSPRVYVYSR